MGNAGNSGKEQFDKIDDSGKTEVHKSHVDIGDSDKDVEKNSGQLSPNAADKEKKIRELALELQRQEKFYAEYRNSLVELLASVEKQAAGNKSSKVLAVVQGVRKAESEALTVPVV